MTFLTGKGMIDDALSLIRNNSTSVRGKMELWLNIMAQKLAVVRPWTFLGNGSAVVTPSDNALLMPDDYGQFQSLRAGTALFFDGRNRLTPGEIVQGCRGFAEEIRSTDTDGVTTRKTYIVLYGGAVSDDVTVSYTIEPQLITDSVNETCWPVNCRPLFMRALLDFFYEYDMDERSALSYQLGSAELSDLKAWDNSMKPKTQRNSHGYRGSR